MTATERFWVDHVHPWTTETKRIAKFADRVALEQVREITGRSARRLVRSNQGTLPDTEEVHMNEEWARSDHRSWVHEHADGDPNQMPWSWTENKTAALTDDINSAFWTVRDATVAGINLDAMNPYRSQEVTRGL